MGLRDDVQRGLADAYLGDLADCVVPIYVSQNARGGYDPDTGEVTPPSNVDTNTRAIFDNYSELEVFNSAIEPGDVNIMILTNEIPFRPMIGCSIKRLTDNKIFRCISISVDPANAMYSCQSRSIHS